MSGLFRRRPSASLIISVVALVIAISGTAVAAVKLVNGDKLIKKRTLSGNRLIKHTLNGADINLKKLGTVPKAKQAATAKTATTARTATSAQTATTAANALALGGHPASAYLTSSSRIGTAGIVTATGTAAGATVPLFTAGPFTVTMTCTKDGSGDVSLSVQAASSVGGADLDGTLGVAAGAVTDLPLLDIDGTTAALTDDDTTADFEAPNGSQAIVGGADGVNSLNADCWANFAGVA